MKNYNNIPASYAKATGIIDFGFTNDYMFHIVFENNLPVLKSLIASLLQINKRDIKNITILNPIITRHVSLKKSILDLFILMNDDTYINLEMQVCREDDWPERSLLYLCRSFDNLHKGEDPSNIKTSIHIGFLDFSLFPDNPEFYSRYKVMNVKTNKIYSDKFDLRMVELNNTELATDEDRKYKIDQWAKLFKADTWEEIKMIAANNTDLTNAADHLCQANMDIAARHIAMRLEDAARREKHRELMLKNLKLQNADLANQNSNLSTQVVDLTSQNSNLSTQVVDLTSQNSNLATQNADLANQNAKLKKLLEDNNINIDGIPD